MSIANCPYEVAMSQKSVPEFAVHTPAMPRKKGPRVARSSMPYTETRIVALKKKHGLKQKSGTSMN